MPGSVRTPADEKLWQRAKRAATDQYGFEKPSKDRFYAIVQTIYQNMKEAKAMTKADMPEEPDECAECGNQHAMNLMDVDVNGRSERAWVCDDCGHAHLASEAAEASVLAGMLGVPRARVQAGVIKVGTSGAQEAQQVADALKAAGLKRVQILDAAPWNTGGPVVEGYLEKSLVGRWLDRLVQMVRPARQEQEAAVEAAAVVLGAASEDQAVETVRAFENVLRGIGPSFLDDESVPYDLRADPVQEDDPRAGWTVQFTFAYAHPEALRAGPPEYGHAAQELAKFIKARRDPSVISVQAVPYGTAAAVEVKVRPETMQSVQTVQTFVKRVYDEMVRLAGQFGLE